MKTTDQFHLQGVQQTLLFPLWARARESEKAHPLIKDDRAVTILANFSADASRMDQVLDEATRLSWAARAKMMDEEIRRYLIQHPCATVINLGAGLDTTFERIDNGLMRWYDLDLPDVIRVRRALIPETERSGYIAKSVFDPSWFDDLAAPLDGVFFLACGLLSYFTRDDSRRLLADLASHFPGSDLVFDMPSRLFVWVTNRSVLKKSGMGTGALLRWGIDSAKQVARLDKRIRVIDEYSWFARVAMDPSWSRHTVSSIRWANRLHASNIFHVRFAS